MKICFIGNSGHTITAYKEMKLCPEAEFVGIAPGSEHEANLDFSGYGIRIFEDYKKMLDETNPDIAVVSPVFGLTGKIIIECAERKIDVFAEKPVAGSYEELDRVERAVKENKIHFSAMHYLRFAPTFYLGKKLVADGAIGKVQLITAQKSYKYGNSRPAWYHDRELYTGTIPWVGIHAIDWVYAFSGKKFLSVNALSVGSPEMYALCQYKMEDGVMASVNIDYLRPSTAKTHGDDRIRVAGTEGVIEVFSDRIVLINKDGTQELRPTEAPKLAYDFLLKREELTCDEVFMLTRAALAARESADKNITVKV